MKQALSPALGQAWLNLVFTCTAACVSTFSGILRNTHPSGACFEALACFVRGLCLYRYHWYNYYSLLGMRAESSILM